jgi:hypothetical protein
MIVQPMGLGGVGAAAGLLSDDGGAFQLQHQRQWNH